MSAPQKAVRPGLPAVGCRASLLLTAPSLPCKHLLFLAPGCQQQQTKINHSLAWLVPDMPTV